MLHGLTASETILLNQWLNSLNLFKPIRKPKWPISKRPGHLVVLTPTHPCSLPPTHAHSHPPMLTPTHPCSLPPTHAHSHPPMLTPTHPCSLPPTHAHSHPPMLTPTHPCSLPPTHAHSHPPMLTPTHPCSLPPSHGHFHPPMLTPTHPCSLPPSHGHFHPPMLTPTHPCSLPPSHGHFHPPMLTPTQPWSLPPTHAHSHPAMQLLSPLLALASPPRPFLDFTFSEAQCGTWAADYSALHSRIRQAARAHASTLAQTAAAAAKTPPMPPLPPPSPPPPSPPPPSPPPPSPLLSSPPEYPQPPRDPSIRFLTYEWLDEPGGLGDYLTGLATSFACAMLTQRAFIEEGKKWSERLKDVGMRPPYSFGCILHFLLKPLPDILSRTEAMYRHLFSPLASSSPPSALLQAQTPHHLSAGQSGASHHSSSDRVVVVGMHMRAPDSFVWQGESGFGDPKVLSETERTELIKWAMGYVACAQRLEACTKKRKNDGDPGSSTGAAKKKKKGSNKDDILVIIDVFRHYGISSKLDGTENHLVMSHLRARSTVNVSENMSLGGTTGDNTRLLGQAPEEEEEEMQAEGVREVAVATGLEVLYQETPNYRGAAAEADRMIEPRETARHAWRVPDLGVDPAVSAGEEAVTEEG
ncbi:unnamed protein product [Closterium sp. Naga37s-1]|nr:unnamed protein product [Closterium sp. Naga37s-1]